MFEWNQSPDDKEVFQRHESPMSEYPVGTRPGIPSQGPNEEFLYYSYRKGAYCSQLRRVDGGRGGDPYCDACNREGEEGFYFSNKWGVVLPTPVIEGEVDAPGMLHSRYSGIVDCFFRMGSNEERLRNEISKVICSRLMVDQIVWAVTAILARVNEDDITGLIGESYKACPITDEVMMGVVKAVFTELFLQGGIQSNMDREEICDKVADMLQTDCVRQRCFDEIQRTLDVDVWS